MDIPTENTVVKLKKEVRSKQPFLPAKMLISGSQVLVRERNRYCKYED